MGCLLSTEKREIFKDRGNSYEFILLMVKQDELRIQVLRELINRSALMENAGVYGENNY